MRTPHQALTTQLTEYHDLVKQETGGSCWCGSGLSSKYLGGGGRLVNSKPESGSQINGPQPSVSMLSVAPLAVLWSVVSFW